MGSTAPPWIHWVLFGLAVLGAAVLCATAMWKLHLAYENSDLTRQTLYEALTFVGGILGLLWAAGFIVATRPKPLLHDGEDFGAFPF